MNKTKERFAPKQLPQRKKLGPASIDDILGMAGSMSVSIDRFIRAFQYGPKGKSGPNPQDAGIALAELLENKFKYDRMIESYNTEQTRKSRRRVCM